jgi:hypothetical protein
MTKNEFTELTGISVTDEQFETINNMYMAAGDDFDKQRFCDDWKQNGESTLMYRFYIKYRETAKALKEAEEKLTKAEEESRRYHSWWIDESDKTEALKNDYEARITELNREHTAFKDEALDAIKFIAGQL